MGNQCKQLFDHLTQTYVRVNIRLTRIEQAFGRMEGIALSTTEVGTTPVSMGTVKYLRLKKRWRWNPRKGLANLVLLMFLLFFILMAFYYTAARSQGQALGREVTVEKGDTLWDLALRYYPHTDPRKGIAQIKNLNNLDTAIIYPGQQLRLPD